MIETIIPNHGRYLSSLVAERMAVIAQAAGGDGVKAAYARHLTETEDWLGLYRSVLGVPHPLEGMWADLKASFLGQQGPRAVPGQEQAAA